MFLKTLQEHRTTILCQQHQQHSTTSLKGCWNFSPSSEGTACHVEHPFFIIFLRISQVQMIPDVSAFRLPRLSFNNEACVLMFCAWAPMLCALEEFGRSWNRKNHGKTDRVQSRVKSFQPDQRVRDSWSFLSIWQFCWQLGQLSLAPGERAGILQTLVILGSTPNHQAAKP